MRYRERRVAPPLDLFVECVWFLSTARGDTLESPDQTILPDGCIELIFHLGERFLAGHGAMRALRRQPAAFVAGMLTGPLRVAAVAGADSVGIRFRPGGASAFFAVPLAELTDRVTPLDDLWVDGARELASRLNEAGTDDERRAIVEHTLGARLRRGDVEPRIDGAVHDLIRTAGRMSVARVAGRAGVTPRHLQRRFAAAVGVPPKTLARILRFQNTLRVRTNGDDWLRVAIDCGYADQSHLIHDYAAFSGETPAGLLAAESELSAYFTAPQRLAALFGARR
jgi:AraC-like DNA-binding protein